jgi:hypothetical protein
MKVDLLLQAMRRHLASLARWLTGAHARHGTPGRYQAPLRPVPVRVTDFRYQQPARDWQRRNPNRTR